MKHIIIAEKIHSHLYKFKKISCHDVTDTVKFTIDFSEVTDPSNFYFFLDGKENIFIKDANKFEKYIDLKAKEWEMPFIWNRIFDMNLLETSYNNFPKKLIKMNSVNSSKDWLSNCESCGYFVVERSGPNGKFWGCSQYPSCSYTTYKRYWIGGRKNEQEIKG